MQMLSTAELPQVEILNNEANDYFLNLKGENKFKSQPNEEGYYLLSLITNQQLINDAINQYLIDQQIKLSLTELYEMYPYYVIKLIYDLVFV